ncbi:MAG: ACP S-malonyltransferase [Umezawaea sp.]
MSLALLFPGQGSQAQGMGVDVLDAFPSLVAEAESHLGYSLRDLCLTDAQRLRRTEYAQPALYVVSALTYLKRTGPAPTFLAGHSVGEFAALFAAGCFDFATGLRLVRRRGELMGRAKGGGMMAVLGVPLDKILEIAAQAGVTDVEVANHNTPEQVVLAGPESSNRAIASALDGMGKCVPLNVSVAAHSRYMSDAAQQFAIALRDVDFAEPTIPVIANVTAEPHRATTIADTLVRHLTSPVRWWDVLRLLSANGVTSIEEVGPGKVLRKMWHQAQSYLPAIQPQTQARTHSPSATPGLGGSAFRDAYGVRHGYVAGSMGHGVSGPDLLRALSGAGLLGFLGTTGRSPAEVGSDLSSLTGCRYGINLPAGVEPSSAVARIVDLAVRHGVRFGEASAIGGVTAELVRWRFAGDVRDLMVKVPRLDLAKTFLRPARPELVDELLRTGSLTPVEAATARRLPVATDIVADSDSVWLSDSAGSALLPAVLALRDSTSPSVRVGIGGGIATPLSLATALLSGCDFVVTGSINQCTPEARTSDAAKQVLSRLDVDDTVIAPAGEFFELGGRTRVVRKGTLFAVRAETLYSFYRTYGGVADFTPATRAVLEQDYFGRPLAELCAPDSQQGKSGMAALFRRYFSESLHHALSGAPDQTLNYQIPCGPAMGSFNRTVSGTPLAPWQNRHVDTVANHLIVGAGELIGTWKSR